MRELLRVEWEDSQIGLLGWTPISRLLKQRKAVRCMSVGFVLADDKRGLVLAGSINGKDATGVIYIPKRQITKRRKLR